MDSSRRSSTLLLIFNLNSAHDTRKIGESAFHVVLSHVGLDPNYIGEHVTSNSEKKGKNFFSFLIPLLTHIEILRDANIYIFASFFPIFLISFNIYIFIRRVAARY